MLQNINFRLQISDTDFEFANWWHEICPNSQICGTICVTEQIILRNLQMSCATAFFWDFSRVQMGCAEFCWFANELRNNSLKIMLFMLNGYNSWTLSLLVIHLDLDISKWIAQNENFANELHKITSISKWVAQNWVQTLALLKCCESLSAVNESSHDILMSNLYPGSSKLFFMGFIRRHSELRCDPNTKLHAYELSRADIEMIRNIGLV